MSTGSDDAEYKPTLDVEDRFSIVPEWVLDAAISDAAVRLYAVLLRFGQTSGARMPARSTLARRMHKKSTDTVDRAMRELVELGAVVVHNRFDGGQRLTNKYLIRTSRPRDHASGGSGQSGGSRTDAATPTPAATREPEGGGGRSVAAGVAAPVRHNPEFFTESSTPPPPPPPRTPTTRVCPGRGRRRRIGLSPNAESMTGTVSPSSVRRCADNWVNRLVAGPITEIGRASCRERV